MVIREGSDGGFVSVSAKPRLRLLLDHFSQIKDTRQSWKVAYTLREVLFLIVCATIANCDDYDEIVDWGMRTWRFCGAFRSSTAVFPASTGCAR
jgi:hypothetical protein